MLPARARLMAALFECAPRYELLSPVADVEACDLRAANELGAPPRDASGRFSAPISLRLNDYPHRIVSRAREVLAIPFGAGEAPDRAPFCGRATLPALPGPSAAHGVALWLEYDEYVSTRSPDWEVAVRAFEEPLSETDAVVLEAQVFDDGELLLALVPPRVPVEAVLCRSEGVARGKGVACANSREN